MASEAIGAANVALADGDRAVASRLFAALGLTAVSPLLALAAFGVWAAVGRPILFHQRRAGRGGRVFTIAKLRTMTDARHPDGRLMDDEARVTPITRLLRRTRLDELPQLLAIARGDMAFIGPRPLLPETVAGFGALGEARGAVRPGLTGWAQVNGNTLLSDRQKLALDIWYIDHRSPALDLRIILSTVATVLRGERLDQENLRRAEAHLARRAGPAATGAEREGRR